MVVLNVVLSSECSISCNTDNFPTVLFANSCGTNFKMCKKDLKLLTGHELRNRKIENWAMQWRDLPGKNLKLKHLMVIPLSMMAILTHVLKSSRSDGSFATWFLTGNFLSGDYSGCRNYRRPLLLGSWSQLLYSVLTRILAPILIHCKQL